MMESHQPLLDSKPSFDTDGSSIEDSTLDWNSRPSKRRHWILTIPRPYIILHILLITAYTLSYLLLLHRLPQNQCVERDLIYSPARPVIKYEKQVFTSDLFNNTFTGPPRPELDKSWHDLIQNIHIKLPKEDIRRINETSLAFADGSGYLASLEVYHDLHCLKRVRQWFYKDTYYPNMTDAEYERNAFHVDHCLEHFRELIMCKGDIALTTFYYRPNGQVTARLLAEHECVNWEALEGWMKERAVDLGPSGREGLVPPRLPST